MRIYRNDAFSKERNMTTVFGQYLLGKYPYDEELAGPGGMHYHVWVPEGTTQEALRDIAEAVAAEQDIVSMSYATLEPGEYIYPKGAKAATMDNIRRCVAEKHMEKFEWRSIDLETGKMTVEYQSLDLFSASAIVAVDNAINATQREKYQALLRRGPEGLLRMANIAFELLNKGKK